MRGIIALSGLMGMITDALWVSGSHPFHALVSCPMRLKRCLFFLHCTNETFNRFCRAPQIWNWTVGEKIECGLLQDCLDGGLLAGILQKARMDQYNVSSN
jgi:hypothetical protein